MNAPVRKRSPRAPSVPLDEAVDRAQKVYAIEGKHAAPADVVAKHLGYSAATNGSAATLLASMRYYGLLDRPKEGHLAVSRDVEAYQFAPSEDIRKELLRKWIRSPQVFADLLAKYEGSLPSAATLKYDLIKEGFSANTADECVSVFLRSVEFSKIYVRSDDDADAERQESDVHSADPVEVAVQDAAALGPKPVPRPAVQEVSESGTDRIPVRLSGGRRAWIIVPNPFYAADKARLVAQIDLLLTDDSGG